MQDAELRQESRLQNQKSSRVQSVPVPTQLPPIPTEAALKKQKTVPVDIGSLLLNAETLIQHGEKQTAFVLCMQALNLNPNHPETLRKMIRSLEGTDRLNEICKLQEQLVKSDTSFVSLVELGNIYYKQNLDEKAEDVYFQALDYANEGNELLFDVYKNLGNIFVKTGDFDAAEEFYNKAHTINPHSDILSVNLGTLEIQKGDMGLALERFRAALSVNPKNDKAWVGLALVHNQMGDHVLAEANIENAIDCNPQNKTAVHLLANWSVRDSKYDAGIEALQNYLSCTDFDEDMSLVLIHLLCLAGRLDMALIEIERFLLWNPGHAEVAALENKIRSNEGIAR